MSLRKLARDIAEAYRETNLIDFARRGLLWANWRYIRPLRTNPFKVKRIQRELLSSNLPSDTRKLIIFLSPGYDIVDGGILSISSLCEETERLKSLHDAEVIMCVLPGDPPLVRYTMFSGSGWLYDFSHALRHFASLRKLVIHVPESAVGQFLGHISAKEHQILRGIEDVHINVLIQNIRTAPSRTQILQLEQVGGVTCTAAHQRYCNAELRAQLGVPLHKLSTYVSPEKYVRKGYTQKEDVLVVSPDFRPGRLKILLTIQRIFPKLRVLEIRNMTYQKYTQTISKAKWSLTFGEGLDNYFVEAVFSGGVSFSVYTPEFFPDDFGSLRTLYGSYAHMLSRICEDIRHLDNEKEYKKYQEEQFTVCAKYYNRTDYLSNLRRFYKGDYAYP